MNLLEFSLVISGQISPSFRPVLPTQQCQQSSQGITVVVQVLDSDSNPVNLRLATSLRIITVRPSGVTLESAASLYTNGLDGKMAYTTSTTVPPGTGLDEVGTWLVQGKLTLSGDVQYTSTGAFSILQNLGA